MSVYGRDFATFEPGDDVYKLAGGLLPEIASCADYPLSPEPDSEELRGLIEALGPKSELQQNIENLKERLGATALETVVGWVERSGIMQPIDRKFALNEEPDPEIPTRTLVISSGVARWMLRRASVAETINPLMVEKVVLLAGSRKMSNSEHQIVQTRYDYGQEMTEADFARSIVTTRLAAARFGKITTFASETTRSKELLSDLFAQNPEILEGTVKVVSNAPHAIQASGQFRSIAREAKPNFDATGQQLSIISDTYPLATKGEGPEYYQNPYTALAQLARSAHYLHLNRDK